MGILGTLRVASVWILAASLASVLKAADRSGISEQELKAAALNQIVHFARWPLEAFPADNGELMIGIFGPDPFGTLIDELVSGESAFGHPVKIVRCFTPEAAAACHVVYVSGATKLSAERLLRVVGTRPVLTVSDEEAFVEQGGAICLAVRNNRIRIMVNLDSAKRTNVTLSSKLLRLAEIVKSR